MEHGDIVEIPGEWGRVRGVRSEGGKSEFTGQTARGHLGCTISILNTTRPRIRSIIRNCVDVLPERVD